MGYNISNIQGKFTRFLLTTDNKNESSNVEGKFDIIDESLTMFSDKCPNTVTETTKISKEQISVAWTSPPEGSGCILLRYNIYIIIKICFREKKKKKITILYSVF